MRIHAPALTEPALLSRAGRIGSALAGFPELKFVAGGIGSALAGFPELKFVADAPNLPWAKRPPADRSANRGHR